MGKLRHRIIAVVLLVVWCALVCAGDSYPQRGGVGTNSSDAGDIVFFLLVVLIGEYGKKLDRQYECPVYCEVDHKHRIINYDTKTKQSINKETDSEQVGRPDVADGQQPEGDIRSLSESD